MWESGSVKPELSWTPTVSPHCWRRTKKLIPPLGCAVAAAAPTRVKASCRLLPGEYLRLSNYLINYLSFSALWWDHGEWVMCGPGFCSQDAFKACRTQMAQITGRDCGVPVKHATEPLSHRLLQRTCKVLRQSSPLYPLQTWWVLVWCAPGLTVPFSLLYEEIMMIVVDTRCILVVDTRWILLVQPRRLYSSSCVCACLSAASARVSSCRGSQRNRFSNRCLQNATWIGQKYVVFQVWWWWHVAASSSLD
jgi:hypothetical protein